MTKLEDRIRTSLHATAERIPATATGLRNTTERTPDRRYGGPAIAAAVLVTVLLVVGGPLWLLTDGANSRNVTGAGTTERFPIPGQVPEDIDLVYGSYALPDPADPASIKAVVARDTADGFDNAVLVTVLDSPDTTNYEMGDPLRVNGHPATLMRNDGDGVTVWWEQGSVVVWVHATNGDPDLALSVAEAARVANTGQFSAALTTFDDLPDGYTVIASPVIPSTEPRPVVAMEGPRGPDTPEPNHVTIEVSPESLEHAIAGVQSATTIRLRGHDAYRIGDDNQTGFVWAEAPGFTVIISGTYTEAEIRAIAESLDFVTEAEWHVEYDVGDSAFELPNTTTTTLDTTGATPAVRTEDNQ